MTGAAGADCGVWGSENTICMVTCVFMATPGGKAAMQYSRMSPPEDLLLTDPLVGEIGRLRGLAVGLSWCELAEGTVRPSRVAMQQVLGQHPLQMLFIDDQ